MGLDSEPSRIPASVRKGVCDGLAQLRFNMEIVSATADLACAFKLNAAFYRPLGNLGVFALKETVKFIHNRAPRVPIIFDCKCADIGNTNAGHVREAFELYDADAVTVNPYLGQEALEPFLAMEDKGIFVLCHTSNEGASEFQDVECAVDYDRCIALNGRAQLQLDGGNEKIVRVFMSFYQYVACRVAGHWNKLGNCGLVVGATHPEQLKMVRDIAKDMPLLVPGIGKQGGEIEKIVKAGKDIDGGGMLINASRSIIFASDDGSNFATAARNEALRMRDLINTYR